MVGQTDKKGAAVDTTAFGILTVDVHVTVGARDRIGPGRLCGPDLLGWPLKAVAPLLWGSAILMGAGEN